LSNCHDGGIHIGNMDREASWKLIVIAVAGNNDPTGLTTTHGANMRPGSAQCHLGTLPQLKLAGSGVMADRGWKRRFDEPIKLPGGKFFLGFRLAAR
jgi:hypothetical protein